MDGYIRYFDDGGKNMTFVTDDEKIYEKYHEIWEVIGNLLKVDFTVGPVRDDIYLVAKLKIFNKINRTTFNNNNYVPIERNHYICIPAIDIDSVIKVDKRLYPQAYLEQCNYKLKKIKRLILLMMKLLIMMILMIVMTVIIKMILLRLDNHKNASKIILQL